MEEGDSFAANLQTDYKHPLNRFDYQVRNDGSNDNDQIAFQADFINPTSENTKWEIGAPGYIDVYKSLFKSYSINNGSGNALPLSNNIKVQGNGEHFL